MKLTVGKIEYITLKVISLIGGRLWQDLRRGLDKIMTESIVL